MALGCECPFHDESFDLIRLPSQPSRNSAKDILYFKRKVCEGQRPCVTQIINHYFSEYWQVPEYQQLPQLLDLLDYTWKTDPNERWEATVALKEILALKKALPPKGTRKKEFCSGVPVKWAWITPFK